MGDKGWLNEGRSHLLADTEVISLIEMDGWKDE